MQDYKLHIVVTICATLLPVLSPFISMLFQVLLTSGYYPSQFKEAVVCPLLKKQRLDAGDMKSYRPGSNLPFLFELLKGVVETRLQSFLDSSGLMPSTQSAYRQFHSTEMAMTCVYNDLLKAADGGQVSALCLLDLLVDFDTVDHELLTLRLECQFSRRAFSVAGPTTWNTLPDNHRDAALPPHTFRV